MSFFEAASNKAHQYSSDHPAADTSQVIQWLAVNKFSKLEIMGALQKTFDISPSESKRLVLENPAYAEDLDNLYRALDLAAEASFQTLLAYYDWEAIANCPGRYILKGIHELTPQDLVGDDLTQQEFSSPNASDPVLVVVLPDGGLISYCKPDGTYVHTLGNAEGFSRKLAQLEIQLKENR